MTPQHLQNAPILEAVIDIRIAEPSPFELQDMRTVHAAVRDAYPEEVEMRAFQTSFSIGAQGTETNLIAGAKDQGPMGLRLQSADKAQIVQLRRDGYTFSRLPPYTSWQHIKSEAWAMWERYIAVAKPSAATRIALRYINKLDLPLASRDLSEFLTTPPRIPPGIPATISGFLHRTGVDCVDGKFKGWITQAAEPSARNSFVTVYLDFDVAQEGSFPIDTRISETLNQIREIKNAMFFNSITEKTVELYK